MTQDYRSPQAEATDSADRGDSSYNGWSNHETWCVNLWLTNESDHWFHRAAELWASLEDEEDNRSYLAAKTLANELDEDVNEQSPLEGASLYQDLLTTAIGETDWREIAIALFANCDGFDVGGA